MLNFFRLKSDGILLAEMVAPGFKLRYSVSQVFNSDQASYPPLPEHYKDQLDIVPVLQAALETTQTQAGQIM